MSSTKPDVGQSLADLRPNLIKEWHMQKNGNLAPYDVKLKSARKVWWICAKGHEWQATIASRSNFGTTCPFCNGSHKAIEGINDLATTNPELSLEWHPTKNGTLKPTAFKARSGVKIWWICPEGHEWQTAIYKRTDGNGCPFCAGKKKYIQS